MFNGMERIKQGLSTLRPSEQKVANYIINNSKAILDMPIAQLAKNTKTSEATIIRMCRSLHIKGFRELKLSISASANQDGITTDRYEDIAADANLSQIIKFISHNNYRSIESTLALIDEDIMDKAIDKLDHARKIVVIGVGASAIVAFDFEQKCKRINKWCEALTDSHTQLTSAVHLDDRDVVLAISYSGETKEIIDTVKIAKKNNANIISLTGYSSNTVQKLANVNLYASPLEKSIRSGATASRIAQLNIVDILFTGLASLNFEQSVDFLDKTREVIQNR
ncbi:transcriptional regulator, RpiR family [Virgibacillus subterraneus]|uniref:Transcriptional regulator, RpiR family n=2 Tax=Virgibacillus TaxID=84406 RepID=A0A1H0Z8I4_9BACI|nr:MULTISPECIES: MurR/RpiR family transcriptional regulator [Virgibacillus]SDQ23406.1 transcriptional regulator, RpiR family [Virgibacillus salinus]SEP88396.1 transcriptional regulator, RpiR family [Virgibacillus subterraneus]